MIPDGHAGRYHGISAGTLSGTTRKAASQDALTSAVAKLRRRLGYDRRKPRRAIGEHGLG